VAGGDLTVTTRQNYIGDFASIKVSMEAIIAKLGETMAQIVSSAEQVSAGADQMSSGAQALSQGAMEQASTL
ncbi:methyl-accepting chemotaxis protein, partial [Klebsiella oxytoca]